MPVCDVVKCVHFKERKEDEKEAKTLKVHLPSNVVGIS